ncbi:uncharacterized protein [Macaca fascicularis]|uniref:uncharacterized protein n=1 Tax=Macaca fascicularis TaxID=9541 RepID=UPI0032B08487
MPENMGCKGVPGTLALLSEPAPPHRKAEEAGGCRENVGGRSETDRPWSSRPSARETRAHRHRAHTRRPRLTGPSGLSRQVRFAVPGAGEGAGPSATRSAVPRWDLRAGSAFLRRAASGFKRLRQPRRSCAPCRPIAAAQPGLSCRLPGGAASGGSVGHRGHLPDRTDPVLRPLLGMKAAGAAGRVWTVGCAWVSLGLCQRLAA